MTALPARRVRRLRHTLAGTAVLGLVGSGLAAASLTTASATDAPSATSAAGTDTPAPRAFSFATTQRPLVAGQYQVAASDDTGELFVTSAQGRPPVLNATLAKVDPDTLAIKDRADLPVLEHGTEATPTYKQLSTHGVYVDDAHDNVWVTNTRDNQVTVYDRESLDLVWTSYDFDAAKADPAQRAQVEIAHPREVIIDEVHHRAYVTAANRGGATDSSITVYDTTTFERLRDIAIPARANYPTTGDNESAYAVPMGLDIDEATGTVYANDFRTDQYYVLDYAADPAKYAVERVDIPNPLAATEGVGLLQPSSIAIDAEAREVYSVNQGQFATTEGSLDIFDLDTGAHKTRIVTGSRALGVDVDTDRGLVYVADFTTGEVTVVDARAQAVVETIALPGTPKSANHLIVAGGSAYMVDKAGATTQTIDYSVDPATGERTTAETSVDSIAKITPVDATVTSAAAIGGSVTLEGQGWLDQAGTAGSTIAVKINDGAIAHAPGEGPHSNDTVWAVVEADASGRFTAKIPLPDGGTTGARGSVPAATPGTWTLRLLSGSLKPGDTARSTAVEVEVRAGTLRATAAPRITGKAKVGKTLKATTGTWSAPASTQVQWRRNGKVIKGATESTYRVAKADAGKKLTVRVVATRPGYAKATATSKAVKVAKVAKKNRTK
ncbi:hypothetical protein [Nocardioides ochotonae]|uniref:hypothetical protein n=1 Tax=Nocardioides ochotonae TaxID=2685869 RepID=UPI00140DFFE2|nr:hypothetical protein [Nocardioides ochotonae]